MIKNKRLVFAMSLQQRIRLITSADLYKSRTLEGYDFPQMHWQADPLRGLGARVTRFPSDRTLACSFDPALVQRVYACIGAEAKACAPLAYYTVDNRPCNEDICLDAFMVGKFAQKKVRGLNESGAFVNYNDMSRFDDTVQEHVESGLINDAVLSSTEPDSLLVQRSDKTDLLNGYRLGGLRFGLAAAKEDVARYLRDGYSFVFLESDFTDELVPYLTALTLEYREAFNACARGKITPEKVELCCRELVMLPEDRINEACDRVIDMLVALQNNNADAVNECRVSLGKEGALFNEPLHDEAALDAARGSVVLIKNDGVLPLPHEKKVAVFGEYAKKESYHDTGNDPTAPFLPFEVINAYDIQTVGFAYGYREGEPVHADLLNTARKLAAKADAALVFLCARADEHTLPAEQLDFLRELSACGKKVIAVVSCDGVLDMHFTELCHAVLLTHRGGQKSAHAVFEAITGFITPSGKLPYAVRERVETDGTESGAVRYPVGYGLSYTSFAYSGFRMTDRGVSVTVTNTGAYDGSATVFLYVQPKATENKQAGERVLRGFAKVHLKKNGVEKVFLPFDEGTFRTFHFSKGLFCIEGGEYIVTVGENESDVRLQGEITLQAHTYEEQSEASAATPITDPKNALDAFADTQDKRGFYARKHTAPVGGRFAAAILLAAYFDIAAALLWLFDILPAETAAYLLVGVFLALLHIAVIVYCVSAYRRHRALEKLNVPVVEDVVSALGNFTELACVSYEKPIEPDVAEQEEQRLEEEREEAEQAQEEVPVYTYDTGFTEGVRQQIKFRNDVTFPEICANFHDHVAGWGVEVDASSVRALFAALAASKLVLIDVKNKEVLPNLLIALGSYFQGADVVDARPEWNKPADLYWTLEGDKYTASGFVNSLYAAERTPDKNAVCILSNVSPSSLRDWFADGIRYALFPSEKHVLKLNDTTQAVMPHNVHYLLFTNSGGDDLPADLAAASVQIEMVCNTASAIGDPVESKPVSLRVFDDLIREAREEQFLPETVWKKLDELVEAINAGERFGIGNKNLLQLERFSSVLLACGADESEAFSAVFTGKIAALLKTLQVYRADKGDKMLFGIIEKLFADENLTKIRKALMKASRGQ